MAVPAPDASQAELAAFLAALTPVDDQDIRSRAAQLVTGALPLDEADGLATALALIDLTTLEGTDTPATVRQLCASARRPDPDDPDCPPVAAVCVYSDLAPSAVQELRASPVLVAAVAGAFPSGRAPLSVRVADVAAAAEAGVDEIDLVIDRGALREGRWADVMAQLQALHDACGRAHMKVILETAELATLSDVQNAAWLALLAGADMVKTSTGKAATGATPAATLVLLETARAFEDATGQAVGVKAAGGIRTAADALGYLALVHATVGRHWLVRGRFRLGASSLLGDLVARRRVLTAD